MKFKDGTTDGHHSRSLSCDTISNTPVSTNSLAQPKLLFSKIEKFYVNVQSCGVLSIYSSKMTKEEENQDFMFSEDSDSDLEEMDQDKN